MVTFKEIVFLLAWMSTSILANTWQRSNTVSFDVITVLLKMSGLHPVSYLPGYHLQQQHRNPKVKYREIL